MEFIGGKCCTESQSKPIAHRAMFNTWRLGTQMPATNYIPNPKRIRKQNPNLVRNPNPKLYFGPHLFNKPTTISLHPLNNTKCHYSSCDQSSA